MTLAEFVRILRNDTVTHRGAAAESVGVVPERGEIGLVTRNFEDVPTFDHGANGAIIQFVGEVSHIRLGKRVVPLAIGRDVGNEFVDGPFYLGVGAVAEEEYRYGEKRRVPVGKFGIVRVAEYHQVFGILDGRREIEGGHDFLVGLLFGGEHAVTLAHQVSRAVVFQVREQVDVCFGAGERGLPVDGHKVGQGSERDGVPGPFARDLVTVAASHFERRVGVNQAHLRNHEVALVAGNLVVIGAACWGQGVIQFAKHQRRIEFERALLRDTHDGAVLYHKTLHLVRDPFRGIAGVVGGIRLDKDALALARGVAAAEVIDCLHVGEEDGTAGFFAVALRALPGKTCGRTAQGNARGTRGGGFGPFFAGALEVGRLGNHVDKFPFAGLGTGTQFVKDRDRVGPGGSAGERRIIDRGRE